MQFNMAAITWVIVTADLIMTPELLCFRLCLLSRPNISTWITCRNLNSTHSNQTHYHHHPAPKSPLPNSNEYHNILLPHS